LTRTFHRLVPLAARLPVGFVAALLLAGFADELFTFLPAASIDAVRADLGLSLAEAGAVLAFLPAGGLLGNFFTLASDFVSRRALAAGGAVAYGAAMIGFGAGRSFIVLAACAFVWGAASDAFVHGTELALADVAGDDLGQTLAGVNLLGSVGLVLAPIGVAVAEGTGFGWRPLLVGGGVAMLAYGGWLATQPLPPPAGSDDSPWAGVWSVLRDGAVLRLAVVNVCLDVLDFAFFGFMALFLVDRRGFSTAGAAGVVGVALAGSVAAYAVLAVTRRVPATRAAFATGGAGHALAIALLLVTGSPVAIVLAAVAAGASAAIWWVALQAARLQVRPGQAGTTYAVIATLSLPALAVPPLVGAIADRLGLATGMAALLLFPLLTLAVAVLPTSWRQLRFACRRGAEGSAPLRGS
jgi:predicted MFS family arabinose efflux permease